MITMDFEEMKKIWDAQSNQHLYAINEKALHKRIISRKKRGLLISNATELMTIVVYLGTGCLLIIKDFTNLSGSILLYILIAWMLASGLFVLVSRARRLRGNAAFDRSILGDLKHAISVAAYQVRFSRIAFWNTVPIAVLTMIITWQSGKSLWVLTGMLVVFIVTFYAASREHRFYESRMAELKRMYDALAGEHYG